jgi:hypothetical protein
MENWHDCPNKKCGGNFDGTCRQSYLRCSLHLTMGTEQNKRFVELLESEGKDNIKK